MNQSGGSFRARALKDQSGQTLPLMAFLIALFLGMAGLTLDLGHAYVCYRELQASTDAAALAGAYTMALSTATSTSVTTAVSNFSSASGGTNAKSNLPNATVTTTLKCLTTVANQGILCSASPTGNNALQVKQSVTIPTYFIRALSVFGLTSVKTITLKAAWTA